MPHLHHADKGNLWRGQLSAGSTFARTEGTAIRFAFGRARAVLPYKKHAPKAFLLEMRRPGERPYQLSMKVFPDRNFPLSLSVLLLFQSSAVAQIPNGDFAN